MKSIAESCSRQLRGWADSLQNSEIKGQRHLNDQSRRHCDAAKTAEEFQQELLEHLTMEQRGVDMKKKQK